MPIERDNSSATSGSGHSNPTTTKVITKRVVSGPLAEIDPSVISTTKHEEWTTSKKKVNHKKKQVETRVQRQIILEDGKVIADSGPQVTTRTTEDNTVEETENTEHKTSGDPADEGYVMVPGSAKVVSEKTETHQTMKETKEENMQLHDESYHELTGTEIHQKALMCPEDIQFTAGLDGEKQLPGKLTHYSSRSQKVTDKEEVKEISELKDGELTTETTRTHHHEERVDDEIPEDEVDEAMLPEISAETKREIEYYNDDDFDSLSDKMRKERELQVKRNTSPERKDPLTRKKLDFDHEEGIRNTETSRWLEDHFGSDESDIVETTKTKAGGNVISIQMAPTRKPAPKDLHEHADETVVHHVRNGVASTNERMEDRTTSKHVSNYSNRQDYASSTLNSTRSASAMTRNLEGDTKVHKIHTDSYQTNPRRTLSPPPYKSNTYHAPKNKNISSKTTPKKTFYLGENGTYNSKPMYPRYESTPLKKDSFLWKSSPSITDDFARAYGEERKIKKHESFRHDARPVSTNLVQRSHSQRESPKKSPLYKTDSTPLSNRGSYTLGDSFNSISQTLPRDTKLSSRSREHNQSSLFRSSYENVSSHNDRNDGTSRFIHVELADERERGSSPAFLHRPEARESHTLPRSFNSTSPIRDSSLSMNHSSSPYKAPRSFYYGEERDNKSHHNTLTKSVSSSSNHYNDGIKTSDSFTFTPNPRSYNSTERSPRSELLGARYHSNMEESSRNYSAEMDRSVGDTLIKSSHHRQVNSSRYDNTGGTDHSRNEDNYTRIYSTGDYNTRNNQYEKKFGDSVNGVYHTSLSNNHSFSNNSETKRHQFMKGLLDSSDRDSDVWISKAEGITSNRKSSAESRQRQFLSSGPSPPLHNDIGRSVSPSGLPPRLISGSRDRYSLSPSPPESPSIIVTPPKGILSSSSFSRSRHDSRNRLNASPSPVVNPPSFTPLSSPLEIKNMANLGYKNTTKYAEQREHTKSFQSKGTRKSSPVMVEIRDWDSR